MSGCSDLLIVADYSGAVKAFSTGAGRSASLHETGESMQRKAGMRTAVLFVLLLALLLPATSCSYLPKIMKSFKKGLTKEEQAEVDRTVRDYNDRILDTTWRNEKWGSYRFLADGSVEEDGELS